MVNRIIKTIANKQTYKLLSILIIILTVILFLNKNVFAQNVTLSVSPPTIQALIKPDKSILIAFTVQNNGDPVTLRSFVVPFEAEGLNGRISIKDRFDGPIRFSLDNDNIELNKPVFFKSRESKQFLLKISVPEKAPKGDYYYSFLIETYPPKSIEGSLSTQSKVTIGSTILLTVSEDGLTQIKGSIKQFTIKPLFTLNLFNQTYNIIESTSPIPVTLIVRNDGDNYTTMGGDINLTGIFGERITYKLIPLTILKNSERIAKTDISDTPECTIENPPFYCTNSSLILKGFFIGKYKLNSTVHLGDETQLMYANSSFIAIPIKLTIGLIMSISILWIIIKKRIKT